MSEAKNWLIHVHHSDKSVYLIEVKGRDEAFVNNHIVTILVQGYRHFDDNTHKTVFHSPYKIDRIELSAEMEKMGVPKPKETSSAPVEKPAAAKPAAKAKPVKRGSKK
jgi:hypothetical protein